MQRSVRPVPLLTCLVSGREDLSLLPRLAAAGVDGFQVRCKDSDTRQLVELARIVVDAVRPAGAVVTVDDRVDVAVAAGADGVHLGARDLPVEAARRLAPELVIGATCRSLPEVELAAAGGADYAGVGPVFATTSKDGLPAPLGLAGLRAATGVLPVVAIGGITAAGAPSALAAGADGIALIGGLWRHPDPVQAAEELLTAIA
ncbi:thiamine phosphate synthase [Nocardioides ferulae]|uniref:thiamine phosphate synthase n=1 Tax=Nocardioides ferulae TaxID=2340821 RepID=UPI00197FCAB3|nr:thiamine phosphate synthase [Nocardioides ferulae]